MPHPDGLPELFLDRSLGRIKVPQMLRAAGLSLITLAEHYGVPADESVADEVWLQLAGQQGWAVFMKDTRIRYNPAERAAVREHTFGASVCRARVSPGSAWRLASSTTSARSSRHAPTRGRSYTWCTPTESSDDRWTTDRSTHSNDRVNA